MPTLTKNYGLTGGCLDASKHIALAANPAAYMMALAQRPWMAALARHNSAQAREYGIKRQN